MNNIEVLLNHAISILKCECESHRYCEKCILNTSPSEWEKLKE